MFNWQYPVYRFFNRCKSSLYLSTLLTSLIVFSSADVFATGCDNITHPGSIGYDQSVCPGTTPATIQSLAPPTGGNGTIEYIWLETTVYPPSVSNSTVISGANSLSYSPGSISQTTYFRRCARRSGCSTYVGETNWVTIGINQCCSPLMVSASVTDALCSGGIVSTSCPCNGKMVNLSVQFNGSNGSTVKVYNKSDKSILINTFNNVNTGDILFVDASGLSDGEFESSTYFEVVGNSALTSIHTSCSQQIDGLTFGDFTVVGYTDGSGNVCNSLVCSGSIDVTVTTGTPPYLYCWSNGSNSEDLTGVCAGTYSLTVSDQNGCSSVHSFTVAEQPSPITISGNVVDASCTGIINPMNCPCSGKMTNLSLQFDGANGSTVKVYTKSDMNTLINSYHNLNNGDIFFVDASGLSDGEFESSTYFEVVGTSGLTSIHTSCSQQIEGMSFGDFTVVGYTDGSGNVCNVLSCSGSINITVSGATDSTSSKSTTMISKRISDYKDDAEEYKKDGSMLINGDHLDMGFQSTNDQIVGMRFKGLNIPQGVTITNAYIEFVAKFSKSNTTNLVFNGEDIDDASAFSTSTNDISSRTLTSSSVNWNNVPAWTQGVNYVSPDLSAIVQEIVNRSGWNSGNDLAIIVDGTGQRPAESYDYDHNDAPLLVIEYSVTTPAISSISYQWSNGATTEDLSNVCAGTYTVTVTDALGCIAEQTFVVTEQPSTISLSATKVDADCGGVINTPSNCACNGKMTSLTVKYLGTNGVDIEVCEDKDCNNIITTFNNVQTGDFLTVSASGLSNGEFGSTTRFRIVGSTTKTSIHTSCSQAIGGLTFGDYTVAGYTDGSGNVCNSIFCNGSVDLSVSGGNSPYTYSWSNGNTTQDLSSVCPGSYSVTVTDAGGCSEVLSVVVDEAPSSLVANVNAINANCGPVVYDPIETCACSGKMTELVILYNGTSSTVDVKDGGGSTILTFNNVNNGDTLVVSASAAGLSEFDSKTFFNDGGSNVEIHTSCSQDIQGGTFGNFKVIGYTDGSGNVCNEDQPPCDCNGEMTEVTLLFNGTNGSTVEVYDNTSDPALLTLSNVDNNQLIVLTPASLGLSSFGSKIFVGSNGGTGHEVHTSCSQDISGLVVGDLTVVGYIDGSGEECSGVECAGSASASPSGGIPPYSFQWSTGDMTSSVSGLCPGIYFLTVTDSIGCTIVQCVEIGESPDYVITVSVTDPSCAVGACDGTVTLSVMGGLPPLTYTWNGPGLSNANLGNAGSNLCAGTYSIVISDANGCSDSVTVTLINPPPILLILNSTDVSCAGYSDGSATVSASGGTGAYSYLWSNGATSQSIVGLSAGTYSVTVTDANGCSATTSALVEEPLPLTASASAMDAQCFATCDGSVTVTANGGNGGLTYIWNDANGQTTYTATGLCAGTYTVTVIDDHGCSTTASATIQEPTQITISINTTNTSCSDSGATGSAIANASGGSPGYTWQWDSNAGNQTTKTATGLSAGNYTVTVTDANGCIEIASAKILEDDPLVISISSTPNSCFGGSDGSASVSASNGQAPFSYLWSNSGISATISGLTAGSYAVTVTDDNGCTATTSVKVNEPDTLIALATCVPVSCYGANDGSASSIVTGGTPPYVLTWYSTIMHVDTIPPDTFPMANNLKPQMFFGFVVDANGCTDTLECEITEPDSLTISITSTDVSCYGSCDGSATANISGGTHPYSYAWSNGGNSQSISGLCSGVYSITVTDANGCTSTAIVNIQEPSPIVLSANQTNVSCFGFCDGTASISASGGTFPYSYLWSNGSTTTSLNGLCAGSYSVTVTDDNGCIAIETVTIIEPDQLQTITSQTNVSCNGSCDGSATINTFGGIPPYSYLWSIGATTSSITGLCQGVYSVTVTDGNGCTSSESIFITEPDSINLATSSIDASCNDECDGVASVTTSGGTLPYSFAWSNGATTSSLTGLCSGNYTVTVTDANQCLSTADVFISEPTAINLITSTTNAGCVGNNTGTASVSASGGVSGYSYNWSNGGNTQTITGLAPGLYTVTVTDANQCTAIDTAIVQEQTNTLTLNAIATDADCGGITIPPSNCACNGGMTNLTVKYIGASGVDINVCEDMSCNDIITTFTNVQNGQFLYVDASGLSGGDFGSKTYFSVVGSSNSTEIHTSCSQDIGGLTFGDYTVAGFTDGYGNVCNAIICNGSIDLMVIGGTSPFTYSWSNGQSIEDISTLCAGVYSVTVMDDAGCSATLSVTVEELPPTIDPNITTTNADCGPLVFDPIETCECNGKMTELVILYNGTSSTVDVKDGGANTILTFNNVNNGDTLVVSASAAGLSEFDSKTFFNDGGSDVEIHTSCSQDIQGGTFGNFNVIGYTDGSGNVCDEDRPPCECNGEMIEVSLLFNGANGSTVEVYEKLGDPALLTLSNVSNGQLIVLTPSDLAMSGFGSKIFVGSNGGTAHEVHTSCSQDISGLVAGDLTVVGFIDGSGDECNGFDCMGAASAVPSGGTAPYTYQWSTGETSSSITGLCPGSYCVTITDSLGCSITECFDINQDCGSIGDYVWCDDNGDGVQDSNEPPIAGVIIQLLDASGNVIATDTTDANGFYLFDSLPSGTYTVNVVDSSVPNGKVLTTNNDPTTVNLGQGENRLDVDFGYQQVGSIGDYVWCDTNGDGIQDPNEPPIAGVVIQLLDSAGNVLAIDTTDENGNYLFENLPPGVYIVNVVDSTLPAGKDLTTNNDPTTVNLAAGENRLDVDFGYQYFGSIGDYVWCDDNGDGIQDPGEAPIAGVVIQLFDASGNLLATDTTDANGNYLFPNLPPGTYLVDVVDSTVPEGKALTTNNDPTTVNLSPGETRDDVDFGYRYTGSIGDYVWCDTNGDGIQDPNEPPIAGVIIQLLDSAGNVLATDTTDANGNYLFENLPPGVYIVSVVDSTLPAGKDLTTNNDPTTVNLGPGEERLDVDFGYQYFGSIGDYVWLDLNNDGIQDPNEPPIAGVTIQLLDNSGNVIGTMVTDSAGYYDFLNLPPGLYTVNVVDSTVPPGLVITTSNDPMNVNLGPGEDYNLADFGYNCVDPVLSATFTNVSCNNGSDGAIDLTVNNGSGPSYSYIWSTGDTTEDISNLSAGIYSVTATANSLGNCSDTLTVVVVEPTAPLVVFSISTKESCAGANNGTATASAIGGTPLYSYNWSNGGTSATIVGLAPGTYIVIVTDANGCTATDTTEVIAATPIDLAVNTKDVTCFGGSDGEALVNAIGGKGPYTYMWDASTGNQTTKTATGLAPGNYEVTVTDANGCVDSIIAKILEPAKIVPGTTTDTVFCTDDATGMVTVSVDSGGVAPFTYQWDSAAGSQTTATATGLTTGTYSVTVTDDNGCTASATANVVLVNNLIVNVTCSPVSCNGDSDGSATSIVVGGMTPYSYLWSNGGTGPGISGLIAGTYTLTLTDANGCEVIRSCTVT
ncbi:MAG: hypothetical protein HKN92_02325, partial [Chitinophagales bacterium]|nr:hypothetical protein [Chitinophagales bacterium]